MFYLITHIAVFLAFASLLGLLLGWLLWGYAARARSTEVEDLRERLADMQVAASRMAREAQRTLSLAESPHVLIEGNLPDTEIIPLPSFFAESGESMEPLTRVAPVAPDLETEVKEPRLQHLEQQLRELQGVRDRLPMLQADLSRAIAGKNSAENKYQALKNEFEARTNALVSQIEDLGNAAREWEEQRAELERSGIAKEKELSTVRAQLRDLQNSQRPQTAEPLAAAQSEPAGELAELREQYQKALQERDSIAKELEFWKQSESGQASNTGQSEQRIAELEESNKAKDASLQEQVSRIETLLWQVAELEPFAGAAPQMEEDLKRRESEIAGHVAMYAEQAEQIANLQKHVAELEQSVTAKHAETAAHEKALAEREADYRGLLAAHSDIRSEMQGWKDYSAQLQPLVSKLPSLESLLSEREAELAKLKDAHQAKDGELKLLRGQLDVLTDQLDAHQQHLAEIERQLSRREEESRIQAEEMAAQHREELTRLKVNSAQRLRRLRQGMTNFMG